MKLYTQKINNDGTIIYEPVTTEPAPKTPVQDPNVLYMTVKPKMSGGYYHISETLEVVKYVWFLDPTDEGLFAQHNCYATEEIAKLALSIKKAQCELQDIATELNNGEIIDWNNLNQLKHTLFYNHTIQNVFTRTTCSLQDQGVTYCLSDQLKTVALKRLGKEKLKLAFNIY